MAKLHDLAHLFHSFWPKNNSALPPIFIHPIDIVRLCIIVNENCQFAGMFEDLPKIVNLGGG